MKPLNYFKKYGCIYGISEKYAFGEWQGYAKKFTDYDEALEWLHTEEYDFRTRTLCSKTQAEPYLADYVEDDYMRELYEDDNLAMKEKRK